jgi:hypothetical protein
MLYVFVITARVAGSHYLLETTENATKDVN